MLLRRAEFALSYRATRTLAFHPLDTETAYARNFDVAGTEQGAGCYWR